MDMTISFERRLCIVNGKMGYFHCWEHYANTVGESLLRGGAPGGQISFVQGIVEFPEGMGYASPADIKFCDEEHNLLCEMATHEKENKDAEN